MAERDFDKLGNIQSALETLRQYNQYVLFPVDESVFENPALEWPLGSIYRIFYCQVQIKEVILQAEMPVYQSRQM